MSEHASSDNRHLPVFQAFAGARVVITGGMGFIGSAVARRLVTLGAKILLIDSVIPEYGGNPANIADIRDRLIVNIADIRGGYALPHLLDGQDFYSTWRHRRAT
jgi:UDP-glucose 4-epimerase